MQGSRHTHTHTHKDVRGPMQTFASGIEAFRLSENSSRSLSLTNVSWLVNTKENLQLAVFVRQTCISWSVGIFACWEILLHILYAWNAIVKWTVSLHWRSPSNRDGGGRRDFGWRSMWTSKLIVTHLWNKLSLKQDHQPDDTCSV